MSVDVKRLWVAARAAAQLLAASGARWPSVHLGMASSAEEFHAFVAVSGGEVTESPTALDGRDVVAAWCKAEVEGVIICVAAPLVPVSERSAA